MVNRKLLYEIPSFLINDDYTIVDSTRWTVVFEFLELIYMHISRSINGNNQLLHNFIQSPSFHAVDASNYIILRCLPISFTKYQYFPQPFTATWEAVLQFDRHFRHQYHAIPIDTWHLTRNCGEGVGLIVSDNGFLPEAPHNYPIQWWLNLIGPPVTHFTKLLNTKPKQIIEDDASENVTCNMSTILCRCEIRRSAATTSSTKTVVL